MRREAGGWLAAFAIILGLSACAVVGERAPLPHDRAFPDGFKPPISIATGQPVYGWGGRWQQPVTAEKVSPSRTPILFIHGNTEDATYWEAARRWFRDAGWNDDELWAPSYGFASTAQFDANDLAAPTLDAFVSEVQRYLSAKSGRPIRQFDIVAHSLGVTAVRQWLTQSNRWHEVRSLVAVAGANHGVWTARPDARGPSRHSSFELHRDSPWLAQLNAGGEVAGAMRVMTLYDGTGRYDTLFPPGYQDSPALKGAVNVAINREARGFFSGGYNHLELPRSPATMALIADFLRAGHEPLPNAVPPRIVQHGDRLKAEPTEARLRCAADGRYPDASTPPMPAMKVPEGQWLTCFAHSAISGLSSPMARFAPTTAAVDPTPPSLSASPEAGPYAQPLNVSLTASAPDALIVYSTTGREPDSGSALYRGPIHIPTPVSLTAIAITPDGRRSVPLRLRYDVSLEYDDALHSLQRQLDSATAVEFERRRD